ncbi:T-cell surface glycoprotein CD3 zeta chain isoform X2 [Gadus morhua]|uniref:T-cell surface glycoprotein CD3 zeta chain isoform X2 n=1 Tax=Gadus morhua TaxID=8049 RepID=UPI0011B6E78B|nr:T-cell surface glycoprotein CD3 zeta chain-like isoform X2 [Gadus morhua]
MSLLPPVVGLLLLLSLPAAAAGMTMYDPRLCYILDGFLAGYGLVITGLYLKEKNRTQPEQHYQPLKKRDPDADYNELPLKRERQRKNDQQVYQDLNLGRDRDTYNTLPMQPLAAASR